MLIRERVRFSCSEIGAARTGGGDTEQRRS
jgi:hypothetical protein